MRYDLKVCEESLPRLDGPPVRVSHPLHCRGEGTLACHTMIQPPFTSSIHELQSGSMYECKKGQYKRGDNRVQVWIVVILNNWTKELNLKIVLRLESVRRESVAARQSVTLSPLQRRE